MSEKQEAKPDARQRLQALLDATRTPCTTFIQSNPGIPQSILDLGCAASLIEEAILLACATEREWCAQECVREAKRLERIGHREKATGARWCADNIRALGSRDRAPAKKRRSK